MDRLDKRTVLGRAVVDRYEAVMSDLGGIEALSTVKRSLVRRFTWFEVMLEGFECRMASGESIDLGAWTQCCNSWLGLAKALGLDRRAKPARSLREIMGEAAAPVSEVPVSGVSDSAETAEMNVAPEPSCAATESAL